MQPFSGEGQRNSAQHRSGPSVNAHSLVPREAANAPSTDASSGSEDVPDQKGSRRVESVAQHDAKYRKTTLGVAKLIFGENVERVHIDTCRASNSIASQLRDLVVIFVGGTGGIGESTCKELFRRATSPRAYIIGRDQDKAISLIDEVQKLNPAGQAVFIQKDISLLKNVDEVCADLQKREKRINCLFLTAGYMSTKGRVPTAEGMDRKMVVNYYSRIRWTLNLMPQLEAASQAKQLSRVISVFAAGSESDIRLDDLDLKHNFTLSACLAHCVLMTDFMIENLAERYPGTSFSHSYPGTIKTGIANELPGPARLAVKVLYSLMTPWLMNIEESGERHFFQMTSQCYPPKVSSGAGIEVPEGMSQMRGMNGEIGSGGYLLDWDGKPAGDERVIARYRGMHFGKTVWDHTMQTFDRVEKSYRGSPSKRSADEDAEGSKRNAADPVGWRPA